MPRRKRAILRESRLSSRLDADITSHYRGASAASIILDQDRNMGKRVWWKAPVLTWCSSSDRQGHCYGSRTIARPAGCDRNRSGVGAGRQARRIDGNADAAGSRPAGGRH